MDEKEVETKEFTVSLRGYDRDEVDAYLGELAEEMRQLKAGGGGAAPVPQASAGSTDAYRQVGDETSKILVAADEAGREIRNRAQKEATSIVAEARGKAEALTRQHQADRRGFEEEIQKLREARDTLAMQLEDVGRRLDETIARLKTPIETPIPPVDRGPRQTEAPAREVKETPPPRAEPERPKPKAEPPPSPAPKAEAAAAPKAEAPAPKPVAEAPRTAVAEKAPPKAEPARPPKSQAPPEAKAVMEKPAPQAESDTATATQALADLLGEVRRDREESRRQVDEALSGSAVVEQPSVSPRPAAGALQDRDDSIGSAPATAGRRLKRLLQEDQNYLLDRLRTHRGKGSFDESVAPLDVQLERFQAGMTDVLADAFLAGWRGTGTNETGEPSKSVAELIHKQIVQPLRRDLGRIVDAGLAAGDTPKAIAERASDVFRVWKGVRTELLGEGLVYAAYHQGLVDALKRRRGTKKAWVLAEEQDCPQAVCKSNADAGSVELTSTFPSGHQTPPAHGGCTCTLTEG